LPNGLAVWTIEHGDVPVFTATLLIPAGTIDDPTDRHGLASLTGDLLDEGAGTRDALQLAEAFAQMGTQIDVEVGPDATSISVTALSRFIQPLLALVGDVVMRPRLAEPDFRRIRELRISRLRQLSRSATTVADRAFVSAVFGEHPYGHGALGTTASLGRVTLEETRAFWRRSSRPAGATLVISGQVDRAASEAAADVFRGWTGAGEEHPAVAPPQSHVSGRRVLLVDRPGSAQSEVRAGHLGPARLTPRYHAIVALNALLGGQFTSRLNRRLREELAVTYGARTSFDFRRSSGSVSCETSVQSDATAIAVTEILKEFEAVKIDPLSPGELASAKASLTRGYVRNFETAGQLARAAAQLALYGLDDQTFDRFVPSIEQITADDIHAAADAHLHPRDAVIVVVGDASVCRGPLEALGPVTDAVCEF
jgi:predicted Zn-dependent peptidase